MSREYIITMTAENRVGVLAAVTNAMGELGAELVEASQTVVADYFTMIFAAEFPDNRERQVVFDHLRDVCRPFGIEVTVSDRNESPAEANSSAVVRRLRLTGKNVPGILRKIAVHMSTSGIDILGLHAFREGADRFGTVMKLAIPESTDPKAFCVDLRELGSEWELDAVLEEYSAGSAFTDEH